MDRNVSSLSFPENTCLFAPAWGKMSRVYLFSEGAVFYEEELSVRRGAGCASGRERGGSGD
ncbi:MAG: hypothetical protein IK035_06105, partial [Firmicutes bacterium]|nr:hypothetical protein [Bacillota bacterium]